MTNTIKTINTKMPPKKIIAVNGINLACYEQGESSNDTIFLLHGWPQTSHIWRFVLPLLSKKYRVIAIDLPGLGDSSNPSSYDTENVAKIIVGLADKLKLDQLHLIGHDIGAWVAGALALSFETRLKTLTVIDSGIPGLLPPSVFQPANANIIWQFYFHAIEDLPEFLTAGKEKAYFSWYFNKKTFIKNAIEPEDLEVYYAAYKGAGKMKSGFDYYRAFTTSAAQNKVLFAKGKLSLPVLAIGGQHALGDQFGISMQQIASHVQTETIADCGHYVPEEQPERLARLILAHVK